MSVFAQGGVYDFDMFSTNNIVLYNPEDNVCGVSSGGGIVNALTGSDNRQKIWNYLTSRGLTSEQAAGVMGNMQSETAGSWSPTVNEYGKPFTTSYGYGIVQWTGGRRVSLLTYLTSTIPDTIPTYYTANYGTVASATDQAAGFVPKNSDTGQPLPAAANDKLLLAELNRVYDEATSRTVGNLAVAKGLGTKGQTEWDAIKQQTTVQGVSDLWLYSYEVPGAIINAASDPAAAAAVSAARAANGTAILGIYSGAGTANPCAVAPSDDKQALAKQILANPNITFWNVATALRQKQIFQDVANGTSNGNTFPCGVNIQIMKIIIALGTGHRIMINDMNRACTNTIPAGSSTGSPHYAGDGSAVDLGNIDGMKPYSPAGATLIVSLIGKYLTPLSRIGQSNCPGIASIPGTPSDVIRFTDACTHLHVDVPAYLDPNLQCKANLSPRTCKNPV